VAGGDEELLRAARNQALYRQVNEKIAGLNEAFAELLGTRGRWICECAAEDCAEPIEMTLSEYEQLRSHPNRFAVLPGHVYTNVERVIEEHERYVVVEKVGVGASFAVEHDPRQRGRPQPSADRGG
jgi:hypothetical protein